MWAESPTLEDRQGWATQKFKSKAGAPGTRQHGLEREMIPGAMDSPVWLAVCSGNTCRSPLLMFLLRYRLKQLGREGDVVVQSAGVPVNSAGKPVDEGKRMLPFAVEALRRAATWLAGRSNSAHDVQSLVRSAECHSAAIFEALPEDLRPHVTQIFAMQRHQKIQVEKSKLFTKAAIRIIGVEDKAYDAWVKAGRPKTLLEESSGVVLAEYINLARELMGHAIQLCSETDITRVKN